MNSSISLKQFQELEKQIPECMLKNRYPLRRKLQSLKKKFSQGEDIEERLLEVMVQIEKSCELREERRKNFPEISYPENLPIVEKKDEILKAIRENQVEVIAGETGSGKTTQLPKMCLEAGRGIEGKIGCTQPRRIAATSLAERIARELGQTPVTAGMVEFEPAPQEGAPLAERYNARGRIHDDGSYSLTTFRAGDGAVAGPHRVIVQRI